MIRWITPAGSLGTITDKEYFEFQFDAYDTSGSLINYVVIAGKLASGFELSSTGLLYGIPVMNLSPITSQSFTQEFVVRALKSANHTVLTDRTFNITLNPVSLPQIYPLNVSLGSFNDGTYIDLQLLDIDPDPLVKPLVWTLVSGEIPLGTTLTSDGRLYGYILPTVSAPSNIGWDLSPWSLIPWDLLEAEAILKNYIFTVQLFDGSRYDKTTFSIVVTSLFYTIDNDNVTIDETDIRIDSGFSMHNPYISTPPQYLPVQRELSKFAFDVTGVDVDHDVLTYQLITPTNFTIGATEPITPLAEDQWWDLTNNQILVYTITTVPTTVHSFMVGATYKIASIGSTDFVAIGASSNTVGLTFTVIPGIVNVANLVVGKAYTVSFLGDTDFVAHGASSNTAGVEFIATSGIATSGSFLIDSNYTITFVGNTDFTSIGAASNTIGSTFFASGVGSGTGQALAVGSGSAIVSGTGAALLIKPTWQVMIPSSSLTSVDTNIIPIISANVGPGATPPTIDANTGWIKGTIGNTLPTQQQTYVFQAQCYKVITSQTYTSSPVTFVLTVLGAEINAITWITPVFVGTIKGGSVSELFVEAASSRGYSLTYTLVSGSLPSGLSMTPTGLIYGRVDFIDTTFDNNTTLFDNNTTTFASSGPTFYFDVRVSDTAGNYSIKNFTIDITESNVPFENLYMKALLSKDQRLEFLSIINNTEIFPDQLLYRKDDPWFGKVRDIKFLFAAGLNVATAATYLSHMQNNQFNKTINLGNVRTAVALDTNFNVKYEVVYLEVVDPQQVRELTPAMSITSTTPPYDIIHSNNLNNMKTEVVGTINSPGIGYADQGALPDWMLDTQPNGLVLGFTYGIVLAYTIPGESSLIAYRLQQNNISFNNLSFVVDRYQLNQALGIYSLPEVGDIFLKFPRTTSFF